MSTTPGEPQDPDPRPQPRYGQYAPQPSQQGTPDGSGPHHDSPSGASTEGGNDAASAGTSAPHWGNPNWGQPGPAQPNQPNPYGPGPYGAQPPGSYPGGYPQNPDPAHQYPGHQDPGHQNTGQPSPQGYGPQQGYGPAQNYNSAQNWGKPKRPSTLVGAMVALLAAAATAVIWGIYVLVNLPLQDPNSIFGPQLWDDLAQSFEADPQLQSMSPEEAAELTLLGFGSFALIWGLIVGAIYLTLAFVGTLTGNVGRILATIWIALSPLFLLLGYNAGSYLWAGLTVGLSVVALVLLWLRPSSAYVKERAQHKAALRSGYYAGAGVQPGPYGGNYPSN